VLARLVHIWPIWGGGKGRLLIARAGGKRKDMLSHSIDGGLCPRDSSENLASKDTELVLPSRELCYGRLWKAPHHKAYRSGEHNSFFLKASV